DRALVSRSDSLATPDLRHCFHCIRLARCNRELFSGGVVLTVCTLRCVSFRRRAGHVVCAGRLLAVALGAATEECLAGACGRSCAWNCMLAPSESIVPVRLLGHCLVRVGER